MKVQIRHSVFETNSSSTHTISICPDKVDMTKYIGHTLKFGHEPQDDRWSTEYIQKVNAVQRKCDEIFCYMCMYLDFNTFINCYTKLVNVFSKYNITCEFNYSKEASYWSEVEEAMKDLFSDDNEDFEEDIIKFIFNDESDYECIDRDELYLHPEQYPKVEKYKTYLAGD